MKSPLVSICIPNYNNGKYLDLCIKSALSQTYRNIEIIFIDDNSTDNSVEIAERFKGKINIEINERNIGQPKNTNRCAKLSKGKYIVILHSDDQLLPDFLEKLVPLLENNKTAAIAVGERMETDETGCLNEIPPFYNTNCIIPGERQAKVFLMMSFLPCQVLMRKSVYKKVNGVDENHIVNLDGLLWFKCSMEGDVVYIQDSVSIYRIHANQTTAKYNKTIDHMLEYYCTLKAMFSYARDSEYIQSFYQDAINRIGELTIRYCHFVMLNRDYDLARRYLTLATVFNPSIMKTEKFLLIEDCLNTDDPGKEYKKRASKNRNTARRHSYDPPEGYIAIK